ncbi:hypothetical protein GOQ29_06730 [Clostridium sp. D2Q-14]|uniref:hypothetical protein n=1 Tax=Anaeromonas gelatinilytica TaxID=2683194 RepID=UPI00193C7BC5|nr:hypothetical protein [Anaeromonas gelatinilytica]MBS4535311.1 hypothetical protein [Anaeromonas gelatinilytica]
MMDIKNSFTDIISLIDHLKRKEQVVGIVEYGGRTFSNMEVGGDYDLTVILNKSISKNFTGVHFHVAGIPTDCMILSVEDFLTDSPRDPFFLVHLNCKILFDRDGITKNILERINSKWKLPEELSEFEKHLFRFTFQHILDKLEHRLYKDKLYSRFFIFSSFDWYLQCYARINNLEVGKSKVHLNYIKDSDYELYELINQMYITDNLSEQFEILKKCANRIIKPIGGLWKKEEILLHLSPGGTVISEEKEAVISLLFE